jgi:anti-anti-sigma regulatory factor
MSADSGKIFEFTAGGSLTKHDVAAEGRRALAELADGAFSRWVFNAERLANADTAGVQLLVSMSKTALKRGAAFEIKNITPELERAFRRAGLDPADLSR